jgi:mannose-1-phosphate guanylyltransferase/mannose-6-phosphate isomerase
MTDNGSRIYPVILSGGSGTRLWPLSREQYPKQLLALTGERTLLQETVLRLDGAQQVANPLFVCNEEHRFSSLSKCDSWANHRSRSCLSQLVATPHPR